ncbi:HpcH/HpaI aldolase/citrate lyase family protein [Pseudomonas fluorescens]|uniref:Citrate lyase subunit beta-like protein n=1 Tax=Pseudomonas fluorescens TaxID=294 RepID=A0A5E7APX3_PSEFL|nr:CoA ester lyase [Pseudomonas fluorescens]VVN78794.1 Citrate lyase subunit beta-like protein [Pseudomonas fluorescens]
MQNPTMRSSLFVPGNRPERFVKAFVSGADIVIVDFEDAVEEEQKAKARANLVAFLNENTSARVWVRVNMAGHAEHEADVEMCRHPGVDGIFLPKAESAEQVLRVTATDKQVIPIVESARGLDVLPSMARVQGVARLTYGRLDLGLDLGLSVTSFGAERMFDHVRYALLLQTRLAGLAPPLESVFSNIEDSERLQHYARTAGNMGFAGMLCIHPKQVAVVHTALAPTEDELTWARRILEAADGRGAFKLDGEMIDAPVMARAKQFLSLSAWTSPPKVDGES